MAKTKKRQKMESKFYYPLILSAVGLMILPIIFGIAGIVLGAVMLGQAKQKQEKQWCYAGIVLGIASLIIPLVILLLISPI